MRACVFGFELIARVQQSDVYYLAKPLSEIVVPLEYGISVEEKVSIAAKTMRPLLQKFISDIEHG